MFNPSIQHRMNSYPVFPHVSRTFGEIRDSGKFPQKMPAAAGTHDMRQTAITVTDFVTRYGSSASGPPSDP